MHIHPLYKWLILHSASFTSLEIHYIKYITKNSVATQKHTFREHSICSIKLKLVYVNYISHAIISYRTCQMVAILCWVIVRELTLPSIHPILLIWHQLVTPWKSPVNNNRKWFFFGNWRASIAVETAMLHISQISNIPVTIVIRKLNFTLAEPKCESFISIITLERSNR